MKLCLSAEQVTDFLNDAYRGTAATDRNLYVEGATYNGAAVAGAATTPSFGVENGVPSNPIAAAPAITTITIAGTAPKRHFCLSEVQTAQLDSSSFATWRALREIFFFQADLATVPKVSRPRSGPSARHHLSGDYRGKPCSS